MNKEITVAEGNHVRVLEFEENHINGCARVERVTEEGVVVSNMNMPYMGTFAGKLIPHGEYEVV
jgi:hypothetical protein